MTVLDYLEEQGVDFTVTHHEERFAAQEEAEAQHISGGIFAKSVIVKAGDEYVMLVLPASRRVDMASVVALLGTEAGLASEQEVGEVCTDCDLGAEPPFGSFYGMATWVDASLAAREQIAIRPGNHKATVLLKYADYARLEEPRVASFAASGA